MNLTAPAVYAGRDSGTTIAVYVGPKYVAHIPMGQSLHLVKTRLAAFQEAFHPVSKHGVGYSVARAAEKYLQATQFLPFTGTALRLLKQLADSSSTINEHDLQPQAEDEEMAKEVKKEAKVAKGEDVEEEKKPGRAKAFPDDAKIRVLVKENPHREGSNRHKAYESAKAAKTVADYEGKSKYLKAWVEKGLLAIA